MADVWESVMYPSSFGGLPIDVLSTRDTFRRSLVPFAAPGRDGAAIQDMGADARVVSAQILFFERDGDPAISMDQRDHVRRCREFLALAASGKAQEFVHPLFGSFPALIEVSDVSSAAEERDQIVIDATIMEQGVNPRPLTSQVSDPTDGAEAAVAAQAQISRDQAAAGVEDGTLTEDDAELVGVVCDDVEATVDSWSSDPDVTPRDVTAGLQRLSTLIDGALTTLDLSATIENYELWRAMELMHYQVRRAANVARQDSPALITVTVAAASPLRCVLTDIYGATDHDRHYDEAIRMNEIDDPSLLLAGSQLSLPTPEPVGRQATRRKGGAR